ncbi:response regulator [Duganella sp. CY15W]|uniref:response regulator transcription factor n=1 Tax=Duganella sp. CY15W TaxID=2692172 RepID=UPI00136F707D|nr:response regulator transcription factor [Duganella sp. CY15W]MYM28713.1 response regulator [Duganella sp. CY15W]
MQTNLLLIEDDHALAALTAEFLRVEGYQVTVAHRGDAAAPLVRKLQPALVILDVMLPDMNGYDVCRQIRNDYAGLILMLTALDENTDQLTGFAAGADDYVVKPVDPQVLLARLRALLRRHPQRPSQRNLLQYGSMTIDLAAQRVTLDGAVLPFSTAEFELLSVFARHPGVPLGRELLLQNLRGLEYDGLNRSIDMRVSRLRKKLQTLQCPVAIQTITAQGYLFAISDHVDAV